MRFLRLYWRRSEPKLKSKADLDVGGAQIVDELRLMRRIERLHRLVLDDDAIVDQHIGDKKADLNALVINLDLPLAKPALMPRRKSSRARAFW